MSLEPGTVKMYRLSSIAEGDGSMQVAYGYDPETGDPAVFVRFGSIVSAITLDGADALGRQLAAETALARAQLAGRPS